MANSVYIHIPFCNTICSYCDFCKFYKNDEIINKYLDSLENEIDNDFLGEKLNVDIYIGAVVVFVWRMFNNLTIIRIHYVEKLAKKRTSARIKIAPPIRDTKRTDTRGFVSNFSSLHSLVFCASHLPKMPRITLYKTD